MPVWGDIPVWLQALLGAAAVVAGLATLLALPSVRRRLRDNPRGTMGAAPAWVLLRALAFGLHRLRVRGREHVPPVSGRDAHGDPSPGPLIVVMNPAADVDPLLVQASVPFFVRMMMARDMMVPALGPLWRYGRIIGVDRRGRDGTGPREALRHLEAGGALGVFPEGRLERPARTLLPFAPGVGLMVAKSGARVLPVVIEGTPYAKTAFGSLLRPSRSVVTFHPVINYSGGGMSASEIARDLEDRFAAWTGWPRATRGGAADAGNAPLSPTVP